MCAYGCVEITVALSLMLRKPFSFTHIVYYRVHILLIM